MAAGGPVPEVQAGQSRCASALHRADGAVSARAVDDAAPAQLDDAGLDRAVAGGPAGRLESVRLSRRALVLQSVLLAGAVCGLVLVRAPAGPEKTGGPSFPRSRPFFAFFFSPVGGSCPGPHIFGFWLA